MTVMVYVLMVYIRKITRSWKTSDGKKKEKTYFYRYQSKRIGKQVISECLGPATEEEYLKAKEGTALAE